MHIMNLIVWNLPIKIKFWLFLLSHKKFVVFAGRVVFLYACEKNIKKNESQASFNPDFDLFDFIIVERTKIFDCVKW